MAKVKSVRKPLKSTSRRSYSSRSSYNFKGLIPLIGLIALLVLIPLFMLFANNKIKLNSKASFGETLKEQCTNLQNQKTQLQTDITLADTCMADFGKKYHLMKFNETGGFISSMNPKTLNYGWYIFSISDSGKAICSVDNNKKRSDIIDDKTGKMAVGKNLNDLNDEISYLTTYINNNYPTLGTPVEGSQLAKAIQNKRILEEESQRREDYQNTLQKENNSCSACLTTIQNKSQNQTQLQLLQTQFDEFQKIGCTAILAGQLPPTATPQITYKAPPKGGSYAYQDFSCNPNADRDTNRLEWACSGRCSVVLGYKSELNSIDKNLESMKRLSDEDREQAEGKLLRQKDKAVKNYSEAKALYDTCIAKPASDKYQDKYFDCARTDKDNHKTADSNCPSGYKCNVKIGECYKLGDPTPKEKSAAQQEGENTKNMGGGRYAE